MTSNSKIVTYYRVSADQQGQSGLGLDAQREAVARHLGSSFPVAEFVEVESGKRSTNRPQLLAALDLCKKLKATLVIAKLDRLARNVHFISGLMESGVEFLAADMPTANKLTIHIMAAFAEHEAAMISARTRAALQAAKARGTALGNPRWGDALKKARQIKNPVAIPTTVIEMMKQHRSQGLTLRKIADRLNGLGLRTPKGSIWYACTVNKRCRERRHNRAMATRKLISAPTKPTKEPATPLPQLRGSVQTVRMDAETLKALKYASIERDMSQNDIMLAAIRRDLELKN